MNKYLYIVLSVLLVGCSLIYPLHTVDVPSLPTACRLTVESTAEWYANYINIKFDNKVYSVTVAHLAPYIDSKPIAIDDDNDIVIYNDLGCSAVYELGFLPNINDELTIAGQFYKQDVWYTVIVAGLIDFSKLSQDEGTSRNGQFVGVSGAAYPGMSGSPVFNKYGKFIGSVSSGHVIPFGWGYSGLNFITRADLIFSMLQKLANGVPTDQPAVKNG